MRATDWEFRNRAMVFGILFGVSFSLYAIDHQNSAVAVAERISAFTGAADTLVARLIFVIGTALLALCALLRTWASAYLRAEIVYAADLKTAVLVADGPYRHVRNPLYFGNFLMALGAGMMASRTGFVVLVVGMTLFCYRLIFREESELSAAQRDSYEAYRRAVPRFWPSPLPRVPAAGTRAQWAAGFRAEAWCWSFVLAVGVFSVTLDLRAFWGTVAVGLIASWLLNRFVPASSR